MEEAALECATAGWLVFPCQRKKPLIEGGFHNASSDPEQIVKWWRKWPTAQIGAALPATLMVLDVDGDKGQKSLLALQDEHLPLPLTLTCHTGGGGLHYYFRPPACPLRQTAGLLGEKLDTRLTGKGYVILPPSRHHETGKQYRWVDSAVLAAQLPGWLARLLQPPPVPTRQPVVRSNGTDKYAQTALDGEVATVASAGKGQRNTTLNVAAVKLGTLVGAGILGESDVCAALTDASHVNGYIQNKGLRAAKNTIRSGLRYGMAHPRVVS